MSVPGGSLEARDRPRRAEAINDQFREGPAVRRGGREFGDRGGGPRVTQPHGGGREHRGVPLRILEQAGRIEERGSVEVLIQRSAPRRHRPGSRRSGW